MARSEAGPEPRLAWVDVAKGLCILLVVLMHATLGVEKAVGFETSLHGFIEWARPFRMPDFFLISGLFLAARIDRPWRSYLDTKVVHFAYFYVLWLTIQFALKTPGMVQENGAAATLADYLTSFVVPFGTLWFIYLLAVYFVVAKLLRPLPKWLVIAGAAALHVFTPHTGVFIVDEFASRFVFFYAGYALAPQVFAFADRVRAVPAARYRSGARGLGFLQRDCRHVRRGAHRWPRPRFLVRRHRCGHRVKRGRHAALCRARSRLLRTQFDRGLSRVSALHGSGSHPADEAHRCEMRQRPSPSRLRSREWWARWLCSGQSRARALASCSRVRRCSACSRAAIPAQLPRPARQPPRAAFPAASWPRVQGGRCAP